MAVSSIDVHSSSIVSDVHVKLPRSTSSDSCCRFTLPDAEHASIVFAIGWPTDTMTHADLKEDSRVMASQRSSLMLLSTPATGERSFASITCTEKSLGTTGKSANAAGSR